MQSTVPAKRARVDDGSSNSACEARAIIHEYESVANPMMPSVPVREFPASKHETGSTGIVHFDLAASLEVPSPATSPNMLAAYVRVDVGESCETPVTATSSVFYVIRGSGTTRIGNERITWGPGDLFATPCDESIVHECTASEAHGSAALYWISDAPLLTYLGVAPSGRRFEPILFRSAVMRERVEAIRHGPGLEHKNRVGILLSSPATPATKTVTHTLWSLLNVLPCVAPLNVQRPHKHNSVALDLCVSAKPGTCYTLMGRQLDINGQIIDPIRCDWLAGSSFITPPGWWHSHHNEGDEDAWVLPVQDAGLLTHQRVLDIRFVDEEIALIKQGMSRGVTYKCVRATHRTAPPCDGCAAPWPSVVDSCCAAPGCRMCPGSVSQVLPRSLRLADCPCSDDNLRSRPRARMTAELGWVHGRATALGFQSSEAALRLTVTA